MHSVKVILALALAFLALSLAHIEEVVEIGEAFEHRIGK
jgi:hypothetical protein